MRNIGGCITRKRIIKFNNRLIVGNVVETMYDIEFLVWEKCYNLLKKN